MPDAAHCCYIIGKLVHYYLHVLMYFTVTFQGYSVLAQ